MSMFLDRQCATRGVACREQSLPAGDHCVLQDRVDVEARFPEATQFLKRAFLCDRPGRLSFFGFSVFQPLVPEIGI